MSRARLAALAVAVAAVWLCLSLLDRGESPQVVAPVVPAVTGSSTSVPSQPRSAPATSSSGQARQDDIAGDGQAAIAAVRYVTTLADHPGRAARRSAVTDLVVKDVADDPPMSALRTFTRVIGPAKVLAVDAGAAAVQVSTDTGPVVLELRRVDGRWLVAGLPSPE